MDEDLEIDVEESGFNWQEWVEEHRWVILMGMAGLILMGLGVRMLRSGSGGWLWQKDNYRVEIIPAEDSSLDRSKLLVDVAVDRVVTVHEGSY